MEIKKVDFVKLKHKRDVAELEKVALYTICDIDKNNKIKIEIGNGKAEWYSVDDFIIFDREKVQVTITLIILFSVIIGTLLLFI